MAIQCICRDMPENDAVLSDVRVLDLSEGVSGPLCTKFLADLGAQVLKVERPGVGDASRSAGPFLPGRGQEESALFLSLNQSKKSITLDLECPAGTQLLEKLLGNHDILIESFRPGYLESLGLGYHAAELVNPGLIYTSITPFGQTGPYRDYRGSEIVAQAMGALMHPIGLPGREPLKVGGNAALYTTGVSAFSAVMLALYARDRQGHGQHVDISVMEATTVAQIHASIHHQFGDVPERRETNLVRALDGWISPGLETGVQAETWDRSCDLMGVPELKDDPRFNTPQARREHQQELLDVVGAWTASLPKEQVYHTLQGLRSIAGYVATVADLIGSEQLNSRGFWQQIETGEGAQGLLPGPPFKMEGFAAQPSRAPAPALGQHNQEVFCQALGYSPEELDRFRRQGVV